MTTTKCIFIISLLIWTYPGLSAQESTDWERSRIVKFEQSLEIPAKSKDGSAFRDLLPLEWRLLSNSRNIYKVSWSSEVTESEVEAYLDQLPGIVYYHKDAPVQDRQGIVPNDTDYGLQWWLPQIKADLAWTQSTGGLSAVGDTVVIALLERQGPDFQHEDLQDGVVWVNRGEIPNDEIDNDNNGYIDDYRGINMNVGSDQHAQDLNRHASPILGIIGANTNNGLGVSAINWQSKIMVLSGVELISQIVEGYEYVIQMRKRYEESNGADGALIVATNASFGRDNAFPGDFPAWCEMYDAMGQYGILTAAATANANIDVDQVGDLPTLCPSEFVIGITSTNREDRKAQGAAFGVENIDMGAPGVSILTTYPGNLYSLFDGTSAAAPMVSGAIGLLYAMPSEALAQGLRDDPVATGLSIKKAILDGVDRVSDLDGKTVTGGRLNIGRSMVELAKNYGEDPNGIVIGNLYPNPVSKELTYVFNSNEYSKQHEVLIFNTLGQLVMSDQNFPSVFGEDRYILDVSALGNGSYLLTIRDQKKVTSVRFVKID